MGRSRPRTTPSERLRLAGAGRVPLRRGGTRLELARAVESAIGPHENASYHVRNAFLLEEAILYEAAQQDADYVIVGRDTKARWRRVLADRLDLDIDLDRFLREHLGAKLVVV